MTDFDDIQRMLDIMEEHELEEFELEREGVRIRLRKPSRGGVARSPRPLPPEGTVSTSMAPADEDQHDDGLVLVKSPIVGTVYHAPEPGADPFVEIGSTVQKGQVLCIIEAMKLMNEIDAEQDGEIANIFVENGQPVQYGEKLFAIKPA